jgi:hypothetical protein
MAGDRTKTAEDPPLVHLGNNGRAMPAHSASPLPAAEPVEAPVDAEEDGTVLSESGAVLGHPYKKYGAYGMVIGNVGTETPSVQEREVRGVGAEPGIPPEKFQE